MIGTAAPNQRLKLSPIDPRGNWSAWLEKSRNHWYRQRRNNLNRTSGRRQSLRMKRRSNPLVDTDLSVHSANGVGELLSRRDRKILRQLNHRDD